MPGTQSLLLSDSRCVPAPDPGSRIHRRNVVVDIQILVDKSPLRRDSHQSATLDSVSPRRRQGWVEWRVRAGSLVSAGTTRRNGKTIGARF